MQSPRVLVMGTIGLMACLPCGCLQSTVARDKTPRAERIAQAERDTPGEALKPPPPRSNYQISQTPPVVREELISPPVKPVDLRIEPREPPAPQQPSDPPEARAEVRAAPAEVDPPLVQAMRGSLKQQSADEVREQLKQYDAPTQQVSLCLLESLTQMERAGGVTQIAPRDLAVWVDRLEALAARLRPRAQLAMQKTCFCSHIENFGKFNPLDDCCFQQGQEARVYVQLRNVGSRWNGTRFVTKLKGRVEIYAENNRDEPIVKSASELQYDYSRTPRRDYFVNIRFPVPLSCPHGSYTVRIYVEDWTDAAADAKQIPASRRDCSSLDFRIGGPMIRRPGFAEARPPR